MSQYLAIKTRVADLESSVKTAEKRGNDELILGGGIALFGVLFLIVSDQTFFYGVGGLLVVVGGLILWLAFSRKSDARAQLPELRRELDAARVEYGEADASRNQHLRCIAEGDLERLSQFHNFFDQAEDTELLPTDQQLTFNPQRNETCYVQVHDVPLGRLSNRTVTRKTGGGYRIGKLYVPVQKERVSKTEMSIKDVGLLAITNKRILYLGQGRNLTIRLNKILTMEVYTDALQVTKDGRATSDYFLNTDGALLGAILAGIEANREVA